MTIPPEFREDADAFPPALRSLLDAELAAGNTIAEVGHRFPAPPAGAYVKMTREVTTRPHESGGGLTFRGCERSSYSGNPISASASRISQDASLRVRLLKKHAAWRWKR